MHHSDYLIGPGRQSGTGTAEALDALAPTDSFAPDAHAKFYDARTYPTACGAEQLTEFAVLVA